MTNSDILEVTVHIAAQPETVFPYFTDPDRYVQWMGEAQCWIRFRAVSTA